MTPKEEIKIKKSKNPITGLINVTGEPDTGKTTFALTSGAAPERTAFIDDDVKGKSIVEEIRASGRQFGFYRNLVQEAAGMRELDLHNHCLSIIDSIEPGKYDVLIWDTWTRFENTFQPVVASNPSRFKQFYSAMGQIKGAEQWNASFDYEASILAKLVNLAPLVIVTSHLKKDQTRVRDIAESKKPLIQKSRMRVWLRHSPDSPQPIGLMLKRLSKMNLSADGEMIPVNVTHRKVKPLTWKHLIDLWNNPVGDAKPGDNESLNEYELSILDGVLTRDQKEALKLAVIEAEKEKELEEQLKSMNEETKGDDVPENIGQFIAMANSKFGHNVADIQDILQVKVMQIKKEDIPDAWERLQQKAGKENDTTSKAKKKK